MSLQEIKEQYASESSFKNWYELHRSGLLIELDYDEITKRYTKAKLEEAGERDKIEKLILDWLKSGNENTTYIAELIKSSITETSLN